MYDEQQPPVAVSPEEPQSPPSSTGVDPRHYKTRLCVYLGGGGCPHGARCFFAHSQEELRPPAAATCAEYKTRPCRYSLAECPFPRPGGANSRIRWTSCAKVLLIWPRPRRNGCYPPDASRRGSASTSWPGTVPMPLPIPASSRTRMTNCGRRATPRRPFGFARSVSDPEAEAAARARRQQPAGSFADVGASPQAWPPPRPPPGEAPPPQISPADAAAAAAAAASSGAALRAALEQKRFTKLCKYFIAGHCPFEATGTCQFAHSTRELRKRSPPRPGPMIPPRVPPPPISTSPGMLPPKSLTQHPAPFNTQQVRDYPAGSPFGSAPAPSPFASAQSTPAYPGSGQSAPRDFPSRGSPPRVNQVSFGSPAPNNYYEPSPQNANRPMPSWGGDQPPSQQGSPDPWANSIDARTGAAFDTVRQLAEPPRRLGEPPLQRSDSLNGGLQPPSRPAGPRQSLELLAGAAAAGRRPQQLPAAGAAAAPADARRAEGAAPDRAGRRPRLGRRRARRWSRRRRLRRDLDLVKFFLRRSADRLCFELCITLSRKKVSAS